MSAAARKAATKRKNRTASSNTAAAERRKPTRNSDTDEAVVAQRLALVQDVEALYRPLREAVEAELAKTESGRQALEATRAFGEELGELSQSIYAGKTPYEEGHRLALRRIDEVRRHHEEEFRRAHAEHVRLEPSVDAVAQILRPELAGKTVWVAETGLLRAMLLQPKPDPADLASTRQGLGDPVPPQPVNMCLRAPYTRRIESATAPPLGHANVDANITNGRVDIDGDALATVFFQAQGAIAKGCVGHDFDVPNDITSYTTTIDDAFSFSGYAGVGAGVAIVNLDVPISIDNRDGTPPINSAQSVNLLTVPVGGFDGFYRSEAVKITVPFTRNASKGIVRILVGADGHGAVGGFTGAVSFRASVFVREICLNSAV